MTDSNTDSTCKMCGNSGIDGSTPEDFGEECPECGAVMQMMEGCSRCPVCGYSPCK